VVRRLEPKSISLLVNKIHIVISKPIAKKYVAIVASLELGVSSHRDLVKNSSVHSGANRGPPRRTVQKPGIDWRRRRWRFTPEETEDRGGPLPPGKEGRRPE
jgi:hypothetical protein